MDDRRELRDKLEQVQSELRRVREHMDKLRAHHVKEREGLERQLEQARRELAELRASVAKSEALAAIPKWEPSPSRNDAARGEPSIVSTVLVALARVPAPRDEQALMELARVTRMSPTDLRLRLAAPPPIPLLRLSPTEAETLVRELRRVGFAAVSYEPPPRAAAHPLPIRAFRFEETALHLESERGEHLTVPWQELRLLVRGRRNTTTVETQKESFVGDGGELVRTPLADVKDEDTEHFLWAYGEGLRVAFTISTDFSGLGAQRALARLASFQPLAEELRRRAPQVVYDDRLMRFPRISLPLVDMERSHVTFADLLWQAVRAGL
jgi:hypothetical protein